ncbi:MAG: heavy-metal-associated domain-containing protein [Nitrospira sp.]|nr:heavy-metal-associated domain-containing protein [Nitrospira sp.]
MNDVTLKIDGMSCGHCVGQVRNALARLDGVQTHQVTVGQASVSYDPEAVAVAAIIEAVTRAGYEVRAVERAA